MLGAVFVPSAQAANSAVRMTPDTVQEAINEEMGIFYGKSNYYFISTEEGDYRRDLVQESINAGTKDYQIVYGQPHGTWLDSPTIESSPKYSRQTSTGISVCPT